MESIMQLLSFRRKSGTHSCDRVEQALHSLRARGLIEAFQRFEPATLRGQWVRGNFGFEINVLRAGRGWDLEFIPLCTPAGPFAAGGIDNEVAPLSGWIRCGAPVSLERIDRMTHLALLDWLRSREAGHPAADWLGKQFHRLAKGERPESGELQGMMLLGARRYVKTIPGSDRLHEAIEPALMTLLRMNAGNTPDDNAIIAGENHGRALIGFLQETHPLEAKRAAYRFEMAR